MVFEWQYNEYRGDYVLVYGTMLSQMEVFWWSERYEILSKWESRLLDADKDEVFNEFVRNADKYLSRKLGYDDVLSPLHIAEWLVDWLHDKTLEPVYRQTYYNLLEHIFLVLLLPTSPPNDEELDYFARRWIGVLTDTTNDYELITKNEREEKIKEALYVDPNTQEVRPFLEYNPSIVIYTVTWFLKRYDLKTAQHLSDVLIQKEPQSQILSDFCKRDRVQRFFHKHFLKFVMAHKIVTGLYSTYHKMSNALRRILALALLSDEPQQHFLGLFGRLCDNFRKKPWFQKYFKNLENSALHSEMEITEEYSDQQAFLEQIIEQIDDALIKLRHWSKRYIYWLVLSFLIVLSPVFILSDNSFPTPINKIPVSDSQVQNGRSVNKEGYDVRHAFYLFRLLTWLVYASVISKMVEVFWMPTRMKLLIPRLFGATFLGYIVLIVGDEVWEYAVTVGPLIRGMIIAGTLAFACLYLRSEIGNIIGLESPHKKIVVWKRTFAIFRKGILRALGFGLILMDLFSMQFLQHLESDSLSHAEKNLFTGFLGVIEWRVWLLFSCVAFLIGIFVQIFWEDKPITEPL